jgi:hypothetical protein
MRLFVFSFVFSQASSRFRARPLAAEENNMAEAETITVGAAPQTPSPRMRFKCTIGINTLVEARYYGEDTEDQDYYPGVVVGFSRDGYMVEFEDYEDEAVQETKPDDVRVYVNESKPQPNGSKASVVIESEKDEPTPSTASGFVGLLPLGDKRKNRPFMCSVLCETNRFYHCGGCPTCNEYYASIGRRNPHVLLDKHKVMVQQCVPDTELVERHYADVRRKNPMWRQDKNGTPILPASFVPFTALRPVRRYSKKARVEAVYEAHDEAVYASVVQEKTKEKPVEPVPYKCSYLCKSGKFSLTGGCPTCNEYYHSIGLKNPMVMSGEGLVHQPYDEDVLRKHYEGVCKNNPEWAKDASGKPVLPRAYGKTKTSV